MALYMDDSWIKLISGDTCTRGQIKDEKERTKWRLKVGRGKLAHQEGYGGPAGVLHTWQQDDNEII